MQAWLRSLDTDDPRRRRLAGDQIARLGPDAVPDLIDALASGPPNVRKSLAFLLQAHRSSPAVAAALGRAVLEDPEPKARKNAAIALGKLAAGEAVGALTAALEREAVGWVRPSIILALGAIGGEAAGDVLRRVAAGGGAEQEALRKALDRCLRRPERPGGDRAVDWRRTPGWRPEAFLDVPIGLEDVASAEAAERGVPGAAAARPGRLRCPPGTLPWEVFPTLRCAYGVLVKVGQGEPLDLARPAGAAASVASLVARSEELRRIRDWLATERELIAFRLSLGPGRVPRQTVRTVVQAARTACAPLGLVDSPSGYDLQLVVEAGADAAELFVSPSFVADGRFVYRQRDVGAAINPVVAAGLVRLVRSSGQATVFDPTCGSGTLLIERALLDAGARLYGLDVSRTAVAAARANVAAAGLERRIRIACGDTGDLEQWPRCDEVIANLPFGVRSRRQDVDLARVYRSVVAHSARRLDPGGRALLFTANRRLLEWSLAEHGRRLRVEGRRQVVSGGLRVGLWVLTAGESRDRDS